MPTTPEPSATERLIDDAFKKRAEVSALLEELAGFEAKIIELGKGKHSGAIDGHVVTVVAARLAAAGKVSYELPDNGEEKARSLSGDRFSELFERTIVFVPCQGFEHVAPKLLTPAKARDLVALCRKQGRGSSGKSAYILWPQ